MFTLLGGDFIVVGETYLWVKKWKCVKTVSTISHPHPIKWLEIFDEIFEGSLLQNNVSSLSILVDVDGVRLHARLINLG